MAEGNHVSDRKSRPFHISKKNTLDLFSTTELQENDT